VKDANGNVIRSYETQVHQGINRLVWGMQMDGIKPIDDNGHSTSDDGLPPGPMVLPGNYEMTLTLGDSTTSAAVEVLKDPRSPYSTEELQANLNSLVSLMNLRNVANTAVRKILTARDDVDTISKIIGNHLKTESSDELTALKKQAAKIRKDLNGLEKLFRTPQNTKGITYSGDTVNSKLGTAGFYIGSNNGAPSPASLTYISIAEKALADAAEKVNAYLTGELAGFSKNVKDAGIMLLPVVEPVKLTK